MRPKEQQSADNLVWLWIHAGNVGIGIVMLVAAAVMLRYFLL